MRIRTVILAIGLVLVAGAASVIGLRAASTTIVNDVGSQQVSVECSGWTGVSDGCAAWGTDLLARGAPSHTFELGDVVRVRLDRPMLGFASGCVAEYFLSRYPDEVAWTEDVPCPNG